MNRWGALPSDDPYESLDTRKRCACGQWCAPRYEHCDACLVRAVRGMFQVDRAVRECRKGQA